MRCAASRRARRGPFAIAWIGSVCDVKRLAILWAVSTGALLLLPILFGKRVEVDDWKAALLASVIIGLINCTIGPVLRFVSLPLRFLTVGLFTLVINAALLWLASEAAPGFAIDTFGTAFLAAIVYSVITWLGGQILLREDD